jgi:putative transcriptional regulator
VDSLAGQLLVSSPALVDPNFRRTVVLIAHHDEDGAMGLVLTRPSDVKVVDAVPALEGIVDEEAVVSVGGPVQPEAFMVLADFEDVDDAAAPVIGDIGFMPAEAEPEELSIRRMRVFAGYAGARRAVVDRRARRARGRVRHRPGRALAYGAPPQGRQVHAHRVDAVRPVAQLSLRFVQRDVT